MIKFRAWWFDLLLLVVVSTSIGAAAADGPLPWPYLGTGMVFLLGGHIAVRPRLTNTTAEQRTWTDWLGCAALVAGVMVASYSSSQFSLWLTLACPVIWIAVATLRAGVAWNVAAIWLVAMTEGVSAFRRGTVYTAWGTILVSFLFITVFSVTMGLMVHAAVRWGIERDDLAEELRAQQAELAESYHQLLAEQAASEAPEPCPLSNRELEVLGLAAEGYSNREIGDRLFVSPATVKTHMAHILNKLDATSRTQAVLIAHRAGYLDVPEA